MNVYDFDETIFTGDVEERFFDFMFKKKGFRHYKIKFTFYKALNRMHLITKTVMREHQYSFLKDVEDIDATVKEYWDEMEKYMKPWYLAVKKPDDVIASGTPRFLLEPIMKKLGLTGLVATEMDPKTGKIDGDFAVGEFKVVNFKNQYSLDEIDNFYSDAYSDYYLAKYAKQAFIVHGDDDRLTPWDLFFQANPQLKKE